jgi:hypothetical protein
MRKILQAVLEVACNGTTRMHLIQRNIVNSQVIDCCNYHNSGHYPTSCLLFKTLLNSVGVFVTHRKHITSPLQAHWVNALYRFVTMIY